MQSFIQEARMQTVKHYLNLLKQNSLRACQKERFRIERHSTSDEVAERGRDERRALTERKVLGIATPDEHDRLHDLNSQAQHEGHEHHHDCEHSR